jgi:taurine dioxygenase
MAVHPVVRVHPETGAKALYVNEHFTRRLVEMNATESKVVLDYLTSWVKNPRFTVRYHWTPGTIAIWDNRCTQHFVLNDFEGERIIQRVTVMGDISSGMGLRSTSVGDQVLVGTEKYLVAGMGFTTLDGEPI